MNKSNYISIPTIDYSSQDIYYCLSENFQQLMIKRGFDIVISIFLLIILFFPSILIALLIKLDSPGPVLFRHVRVGKNGKIFMLWKFRSMMVNVLTYDASPKASSDLRLTRCGRLIRRFSIDEVPQIINVLKGDMSLVGPRPEMPFIVDSYGMRERKRLSIKPGITGLWQISPARAFPIHKNLEYDLYYINHQSIFLDCAIILQTALAIIRGIGAV